eukprot:7950587-Pyramimonas_sp.AAC.1
MTRTIGSSMAEGGGPELAAADALRAIRADPSYAKGCVPPMPPPHTHPWIQYPHPGTDGPSLLSVSVIHNGQAALAHAGPSLPRNTQTLSLF